MKTVGVAGLGRMGAAMVPNLSRAGASVVLWNRTRAKADELARQTGAAVCDTPRELAERCDVVITVLADDEAAEQVHHGDDGLFRADGGATHLVQMGTLSPRCIRRLASEAGNRTVIDAPVSGSVDAARGATLTILVGADEAVLDPVRPVLEALGSEILCLGAVGQGATMKLAVNMLIHGLNQTVAESLALSEAAGISTAVAYRAIERSAAAAPMLGYRKQLYLDERSAPVSFALTLARKDVALALDLADELGVTMPQTRCNRQQLDAAEAAGYGPRDMASMVDYVRGAS